MDVNVELFSPINTKLQSLNFMLLIILTASLIVCDSFYDLNGYVILASIGGIFAILIIINQIWQKKSISSGKITFKMDSVVIIENEKELTLQLSSLKYAKVSAKSYFGKSLVGSTFYVDFGEDNYFWPNKYEEAEKFKFKLIGREHTQRLESRIDEWKKVNPSVEINTGFWI